MTLGLIGFEYLALATLHLSKTGCENDDPNASIRWSDDSSASSWTVVRGFTGAFRTARYAHERIAKTPVVITKPSRNAVAHRLGGKGSGTVAYGPSIAMLKGDSPIAGRVAETLRKRVKVVACENTMKAQKLVYANMLPDVGNVPAGVVELMQKQQQGYALNVGRPCRPWQPRIVDEPL